jgi:hypothetical protein
MSPCSTCVVLTIEIELPQDLSDELIDEMTEDLTNELNLDRLRKAIKSWARFYTGEVCHVALDVE